jgi:hypothetical protein
MVCFLLEFMSWGLGVFSFSLDSAEIVTSKHCY